MMAANLFMNLNDWDKAQALVEESLQIARELGSLEQIAFNTGKLGQIAQASGELELVRQRYAEAIRLHRQL